MALRVVGAGLGRTGTNSLKVALEQLLEGRCYHMYELFGRAQDLPAWEAAVRGQPVDWDGLLHEYVATVDWPAAAFWRELYAANPKAVVLLSTRDSARTWWESMERTIVPTLSRPAPAGEPDTARGRAMVLEWQPSDGWDPICAALGLPVPRAPFPHENTTADFRATLAPQGLASE